MFHVELRRAFHAHDDKKFAACHSRIVPRGTSTTRIVAFNRRWQITCNSPRFPVAGLFHVEHQGGRPHFQIGMFVTVRGMKRSCTLFTGVIISSNCVIGLRDKMIREGQYGKL